MLQHVQEGLRIHPDHITNHPEPLQAFRRNRPLKANNRVPFTQGAQ